MGDVNHQDLQALGDRITATVRHEVQTLRNEVMAMSEGTHRRIDEVAEKVAANGRRLGGHSAAIAEVRGRVDGQAQRIGRCERECREHGRALARVDERLRAVVKAAGTVRTSWAALSRLTKAAVSVAVVLLTTGVAGDGARHIGEIVGAVLQVFFK